MKKQEVPQHPGLFGERKAVCYALDEEGDYVLAPTAGWNPVNLANRQAWEELARELTAIHGEVRAGRKSPLAYHMARRQMDAALLARYARLSRWRVRRHLRPEIFARLDPALLARYAEVLGISVEELCRLPETPTLEVPEIDETEESR
jgi:hypothetical protein